MYLNTSPFASSLVLRPLPFTSSRLSVLKKDSASALSHGLPGRDMDRAIPWDSRQRWNARNACWRFWSELDRLPISCDRVFAFWVRECRIVAVNGGMYDGRLGMLRENRELVLDLLYLDFSTIYALSWQEMVMPVSIHYALDTSRRHQFRYHKSVRR